MQTYTYIIQRIKTKKNTIHLVYKYRTLHPTTAEQNDFQWFWKSKWFSKKVDHLLEYREVSTHVKDLKSYKIQSSTECN